MTADEKRNLVIQKYRSILGRNCYSNILRDYCFRKYINGKYYSDCSSSISYAYREAGFGFGILNTVGMYQSEKFSPVPVVIRNGMIQNTEVLRVGDILLFAGNNTSRDYAEYVGHSEMIYSIDGQEDIRICGHGYGTPSVKDLMTYCRNRYKSKSETELGNKRLIRVIRFIPDDKV